MCDEFFVMDVINGKLPFKKIRCKKKEHCSFPRKLGFLFRVLYLSCDSIHFNSDNCEEPVVCQVHDEIPQHHEVEANEKSQCSPTVRHQGGEGGGLLLSLHLDLATTEHDPQTGQVGGTLIFERTVQQLIISSHYYHDVVR